MGCKILTLFSQKKKHSLDQMLEHLYIMLCSQSPTTPVWKCVFDSINIDLCQYKPHSVATCTEIGPQQDSAAMESRGSLGVPGAHFSYAWNLLYSCQELPLSGDLKNTNMVYLHCHTNGLMEHQHLKTGKSEIIYCINKALRTHICISVT